MFSGTRTAGTSSRISSMPPPFAHDKAFDALAAQRSSKDHNAALVRTRSNFETLSSLSSTTQSSVNGYCRRTSLWSEGTAASVACVMNVLGDLLPLESPMVDVSVDHRPLGAAVRSRSRRACASQPLSAY
ncbi:hypothetical protein L1887_54191 [Cichorium endivia]|nr:hypothetical protein L1887_54191 [Cichorium endivia]